MGELYSSLLQSSSPPMSERSSSLEVPASPAPQLPPQGDHQQSEMVSVHKKQAVLKANVRHMNMLQRFVCST